MLQTAKVFSNGRSQAVRLPLEYRFSTAEVFIRRNLVSGDVILSNKPNEWQGLLDAVAQNQSEDFVIPRKAAGTRRDPFQA